MYERNILNKFKDILGEYCAINQFIELSKRCFVKEHASEIRIRKDFITLATQNAVTLTSYNAEHMVNAISRSYIVNVHLCFETFLKDVYEQVKRYGKCTFQNRSQTESWLKCTVKNVVGDVLPEDKQSLVELCEYYRLIRNTAVHDLHDINTHNTEYSKLLNYNFKTEAKFSKLSAPNSYENISFDDFVLFSRSCVELATYLFDEIIYDYDKIIMDMPKALTAALRKYKPLRREKAIITYINTMYKTDDTLADQLPHLVDLIMAR